VDWAGGTLDDLISLLSAPAWSARVEVLPSEGAAATGEVHVIAGGVSDAIIEGKSTYDALDRLRAIKGARFRVEPRLPNPTDGDLTFPGPDQGKLDERRLATLMRYCEDYVLTCGIEVWRANESAKVDYRRGEIVGVTVGGIDAPERLAEVMQWASGSYRLVSPKLKLPEVAPKGAAPAPAAVVTPRPAGAASKTIFGMPALDPALMAATADRLKAQSAAPGTTPPSRPTAPTTPSVPTATAAPPAAAAAPAAPARERPTGGAAAQTGTAAKTMFGVPAAPAVPATPATPAAKAPTTTAAPPAAAAPTGRASGAAPTATAAPPAEAPPAADSGKGARPSSARPTHIRPTTVATAGPPPGATVPPAASTGTPAPVPAPAATTAPPPAATPAPVAATSAPQPAAPAAQPAAPAAPAAQPAAPARAPEKPRATGPGGAAAREDKTVPTRAPTAAPPRKETPIWTYIFVGFVFGLVLLGIYRLVMVVAN
jgi:hypothetical protein